MFVNFHSTITAVADSMIRELCLDTGNTSYPLDKVVRFLEDQHGRMPDYLPLPFKCLVLIFDAWSYPFTGRPFHRLPHRRRWRQIQAWKKSLLGFRRDLIRFFETLTVFSWYSESVDNELIKSGLTGAGLRITVHC